MIGSAISDAFVTRLLDVLRKDPLRAEQIKTRFGTRGETAIRQLLQSGKVVRERVGGVHRVAEVRV